MTRRRRKKNEAKDLPNYISIFYAFSILLILIRFCVHYHKIFGCLSDVFMVNEAFDAINFFSLSFMLDARFVCLLVGKYFIFNLDFIVKSLVFKTGSKFS